MLVSRPCYPFDTSLGLNYFLGHLIQPALQAVVLV